MQAELGGWFRRLATGTVAAAAVASAAAQPLPPGPAGPARGDELLFMSNRANNVYEHYRMQPESGRVQRVLAERGETGQMSWSPDGTQVLFLAARGGPVQNIYVTSLADGRTRQLTRESQPVAEPVWSPDGRSIAFVSSRDGPRRIYLMSADGSNPRRLTRWDSTDELAPAFSPDGTRIAFLAAFDLKTLPRASVLDLASGQAKVVSNNKARGNETGPTWSPDGKTLLTAVVRSQQTHLVAIAADGSTSTDLTKGDGRHVDPQWSPDGKSVLYLAVLGSAARQGLYLMNADGSNARKLHGAEFDVMGARWSLDGRRIYFVEHLDVGGKIFSIDPAGQELRRLSGDEGFDVDVQLCCRTRAARIAGVGAAPQ
jgi:Tol biopolymer transport system component